MTDGQRLDDDHISSSDTPTANMLQAHFGDRKVPPLSGRALRFVLVDQIRRNQTMTIAQLVARLADQGHTLHGRPSKVISDALRWEDARDRIVRVGRGEYRYGTPPAATARRIRIFAERCDAWIVAVMRGQQPPPTPPNRRAHPTCGRAHDAARPPWTDLGWLWTA